MKINMPVRSNLATHEGAPAKRINAELQLRRSLLSCLLWENSFYEEGENIAKRIIDLVPQVEPCVVQNLALEARGRFKLRHAPLLLVREMARLKSHRGYVSTTLEMVIQRADELAEFVALYWKDGRQPLSAQVKKGLAAAFCKFNAYQLAKYNRDGAVKLRDVLFLCHAKPASDEQAETWKKLIAGTLESPDTWEVNLSSGADKRETWERLLAEEKLGALALLRNLRNMQQSGVDQKLVFSALEKMNTERVLPYRFIAAAKAAPAWEDKLEQPMLKCLEGREKLPGRTIILVDVSGSMDNPLSSKSDLMRLDAACGLAILARELCEDCGVMTFSNDLKVVPPRRGFALRNAIVTSQGHGGTRLGAAVKYINQSMPHDRLIVITDEQSHDIVPDPVRRGYMINVASEKNGVGYGRWLHIDGFSEAIFDYLIEYEKS